MTGKI
jgi:hypothetical protein